MWWWGSGFWWPGFALMVAFMLLCGVYISRIGGMRGMRGNCGWWRRREDTDPTDAAEGTRRSSDREEQVPHEAQPDRRAAR